MQLTIEIPNQPLYDKIVWLLNKFKDDGVEIVTLPEKELQEKNDLYFNERQERLMQLRDDITSGEMPMYDFDSSMDELIEELRA
jgi:hypothetical protein